MRTWHLDVIDAVRGFLNLLDQSEPPGDEVLARALDELAVAYHGTPEGTPSDSGAEPPDVDYRLTRSRVEKLFPDLGFYATSNPLKLLSQAPLVGDAIDDITDIARDLTTIHWRWETLGSEDANWFFRFGYHAHWGHHLHELRRYMHAKLFC